MVQKVQVIRYDLGHSQTPIATSPPAYIVDPSPSQRYQNRLGRHTTDVVSQARQGPILNPSSPADIPIPDSHKPTYRGRPIPRLLSHIHFTLPLSPFP